MKPLTIEELKALPIGDWVWLIDIERNEDNYATIINSKEKFEFLTTNRHFSFDYITYETKWLAYKNKEQAEGNLYQIAFELILQDVYKTRLQADVLSCSSCPFMEEIFDECQNQGLYEDCKKRWQEYYISKAERRLAELKGEKI